MLSMLIRSQIVDGKYSFHIWSFLPPLLLFVVGIDYGRWIHMIAVSSVAYMLHYPSKSTLPSRIRMESISMYSSQHGFGRAVARGLDEMKGDAVVIMMADESDDCHDVVRYWQKLNEGYECVFGSRFMKGGAVIDYPRIKLILNRLANLFLKILFHIRLNDTTNAFKAYRKLVIDGCRPLISPHFNLTVELPLKAIVRGYSWTTIPITWRNRRTGTPKLKIKEMGSRYLFVCLYVWLEKYFSRGDYRKLSSDH